MSEPRKLVPKLVPEAIGCVERTQQIDYPSRELGEFTRKFIALGRESCRGGHDRIVAREIYARCRAGDCEFGCSLVRLDNTRNCALGGPVHNGDARLGLHEFESRLQEFEASVLFGLERSARSGESQNRVRDGRSHKPDLKSGVVYCGSDALS